MNESRFDAIVSDFYRAATGSLSWDLALDSVRTAFGARYAVLHTMDFSNGHLLSLECGGPDTSDCLLGYLRTYHTLDPRRERTMKLGAAGFGTWQHCTDNFDDAFVANHGFYQDFSLAYDVRFGSHVVFPMDGSVGTGFALELPASRGPLDADEREMARRLGEHMRDALQAYQRVRTLMAKALAGHTLLETFPYPMWLIDSDRFVVFENPVAVGETTRAQRVVRRGQHLALAASPADRQLTERLHGLTQAGHGTSTVIDLRADMAELPVWLHLSLLVPGAVLGAFGERPQILATLFDSKHVSALDPFALSNMFGLTPTEARVATRMADGMTADQISRAHGTAESTVRTQVREVLHKLGAQRTVDVVRMLRQGQALWATAGSSA
jgi:DNA-binding CsgD family transcriptional regulator